MRKKVCFFTNSLRGGGAEKVLQILISNLDNSKFDITLYSIIRDSIEDDYPKDIRYRYIFDQPQYHSSAARILLLKCVNAIKLFFYYHFPPSVFYTLCVTDKFDAEVAFIEGYSTRLVSGSRNPNSKKFAWIHTDLSTNHWTDVAFRNNNEEITAYNKFDCVIAVSENARKAAESLFPSLKKCCVIYNPINSEEIIEKSKEKLS